MDECENMERETPIESPSATTSSRNSSGPLVYFAAVIVLGLALLGSRAMSAGMRTLIAGLPERIAEMRELDDGPLSSIGKSSTKPSPAERARAHGDDVAISLEEALTLDLAIRSTSLDDLVDAYSYANADSAVSAYVRALVAIDAECSASIDRSVRSALRDGSHARESLLDARDELDACIAALEELEGLDHPASDECAAALESARGNMLSRYGSMNNEIDLLLQDGDIDLNTLAETDIEIRESTEGAAADLETALRLSKTH